MNVRPSRPPTARASVGGIAAALIAFQIVRLAGRSYIDPGSGSFAIQIIVAAVLGGLLSARLWFRYVLGRIIGVFRRSTPEESPSAEEASRDDG